jgi:hypothetical protein
MSTGRLHVKRHIVAMLALASSLGFSTNSAWAADAPTPSNKWRIECDNTATSDGTIDFRVTPKAGAPVEVAVPIKAKTSENKVAEAIREHLANALDAKTYHVEVDDGEDVLVKKKKGPDFVLELAGTNVQGTRIKIEKE